MEYRPRTVLCAAFYVCVSLAVAGSSARAGLPDAVAAYRAGDYKEALKEFQSLAEAGNAVAQYNVGVMYLTGQGVKKNLLLAARWHRIAADQGLAIAEYGLGVMYYRGDGIAQDYAEAARWFRKAANQGYANAQFNLGVMHLNGQGLKREMVEVVKWIGMAAAKGHAEALYRLGVMYETGEPFQADPAQALVWYRLAADAGHRAALARARALGAKVDPGGAGIGDPLLASPASPPKTMSDPPPPKADTTPPQTIQTEPRPASEEMAKVSGDGETTSRAGPEAPVLTPPPAASSAKAKPQSLLPLIEPPPPLAVPKPPPMAAPRPSVPSSSTEQRQDAENRSSKQIVLKPPPLPKEQPKPNARVESRSPIGSAAEELGWSVQLAAFRSEAEADEAWNRFSRQNKAILTNLRPLIKQINLGSRGVYHRLRVVRLQNKTAAEAFCQQVRTRNPSQGCIPVPPGRK